MFVRSRPTLLTVVLLAATALASLGAQTPPPPTSPPGTVKVPPAGGAVTPAPTKTKAPQPPTGVKTLPGRTLSPVAVRTLPLHHMNVQDAIRLLGPYVRHPQGGIFDAGQRIAAVTVREDEQTLATIARVLAEYDRSPAILTFQFQLIAADDTAGRDPSIASVDSVLRDLFKFRGYRLLAEGAANASEHSQIQQTMGAGAEQFTLEAQVNGVRVVDGRGTVSITVNLRHPRGAISQTNPNPNEVLLSTGVTVPIGQTVVLGSTVSRGSTKALILTVRPDIAGSGRR